MNIQPRYSRTASGDWPPELVSARDFLVRTYDGVDDAGAFKKGGLWLFFTNIRPVKSPSLPFRTLAIDPFWRLFWYPAYVEQTPQPRLAAALMHECNHLLRQHADRFSDLLERLEKRPLPVDLTPDGAAKLWNFAADAEINGRLKAVGTLDVGEDWIYPEAFGASSGGYEVAETLFRIGAEQAGGRGEEGRQQLEDDRRLIITIRQQENPGKDGEQESPGGEDGDKAEDQQPDDPRGTPGADGPNTAGGQRQPGQADRPDPVGPRDGEHGSSGDDSGPDADEDDAADEAPSPGDAGADDPDEQPESEDDQDEGDDPADGQDAAPGGGSGSGDPQDGLEPGSDNQCSGYASLPHQDLPDDLEAEAERQGVPRLPKDAVDEVLDAVAQEMLRPDSGQSSQTRGSGGGEQAKQWAEARLAGRYRWQDVLLQLLGKALIARGATDYTFQRPSRRAAATPGIILPRTIARMPEIVGVMDTSGSVGQDIRDWMLSEIRNIAQVLGTPVVFGFCDDRMTGFQKIDGNTTRLSAPGGRGTDMRIGVKWAEENYPNALATVLLTDGFTPWPETRGRRPLIIGLFGNYSNCMEIKDRTPAWAKTLVLAKPDGNY